MSEKTNSTQSILLEALEIQDQQQRATFVARACAGDSELRREVEDLIQAHSAADQFLPEKSAVTEVRSAVIRTAEAAVPEAQNHRLLSAGNTGDRVGHYKLL